MAGGTPVVMIIGEGPWLTRVRARMPAGVEADALRAIPPALNDAVKLVIVQPDRVPSAEVFAAGRRPTGVRWLCCGDRRPADLAAEIDWRGLDDAGLTSLIAARIEQHAPNPTSTPEADEFSRRIEDDVFFGLVINHASRLLKNWEKEIGPTKREQGEGKCDDLGLKHHLNRLHYLLSNSVPLSAGVPAPTVDHAGGAQLFQSLYVSEKTVLLARRHYPQNTCYQSTSSVERAGLDERTLVRCDDGFLVALLITILAAAPPDRIDSVRIELSPDGAAVRLDFPFAFEVPEFRSEPNAPGATGHLGALDKVLRKYSASQESPPGRFTLVFELQRSTP